MSRLLRLISLLAFASPLAAQAPGPRLLVREAPVAKHTEKEQIAARSSAGWRRVVRGSALLFGLSYNLYCTIR